MRLHISHLQVLQIFSHPRNFQPAKVVVFGNEVGKTVTELPAVVAMVKRVSSLNNFSMIGL